jgi:hypothetical protein
MCAALVNGECSTEVAAECATAEFFSNCGSHECGCRVRHANCLRDRSCAKPMYEFHLDDCARGSVLALSASGMVGRRAFQLYNGCEGLLVGEVCREHDSAAGCSDALRSEMLRGVEGAAEQGGESEWIMFITDGSAGKEGVALLPGSLDSEFCAAVHAGKTHPLQDKLEAHAIGGLQIMLAQYCRGHSMVVHSPEPSFDRDTASAIELKKSYVHRGSSHPSITYHAFWVGPVTEKQLLSIKSCYYFNVQNAGESEDRSIILWTTNVSQALASPISAELQQFAEIRHFDTEEESKGTPFESKYEEQAGHFHSAKFFSDVVRLILLYKYGGFWYGVYLLPCSAPSLTHRRLRRFDIDIVFLQPLDPVLEAFPRVFGYRYRRFPRLAEH